MNKPLIVALAGALVLAVAGQAGEGKKPAGARPAGRPLEMPLLPPRLAEKLNLTDQQKAQVQDIEAAYAKERDALLAGKRDQLAELNAQAKAAREADNEAQMKELREQRRELMQPLAALRRQHMEKVHALLTAEQKAIMAEAREHMQERRGKRPGGGPPPPAE